MQIIRIDHVQNDSFIYLKIFHPEIDPAHLNRFFFKFIFPIRLKTKRLK